MELRERLLEKMTKGHPMLFVCLIGLSLLINIPSEFYFTLSYETNSTHIALFAAIVFLVLNPQGIRLLVVLLFAVLGYCKAQDKLSVWKSKLTAIEVDKNSGDYKYRLVR